MTNPKKSNRIRNRPVGNVSRKSQAVNPFHPDSHSPENRSPSYFPEDERPTKGLDIQPEVRDALGHYETLSDALKTPAHIFPDDAAARKLYPEPDDVESLINTYLDIIRFDVKTSMALYEALRRWSILNRRDDLEFTDTNIEGVLKSYTDRLLRLYCLTRIGDAMHLPHDVQTEIIHREIGTIFPSTTGPRHAAVKVK